MRIPPHRCLGVGRSANGSGWRGARLKRRRGVRSSRGCRCNDGVYVYVWMCGVQKQESLGVGEVAFVSACHFQHGLVQFLAQAHVVEPDVAGQVQYLLLLLLDQFLNHLPPATVQHVQDMADELVHSFLLHLHRFSLTDSPKSWFHSLLTCSRSSRLIVTVLASLLGSFRRKECWAKSRKVALRAWLSRRQWQSRLRKGGEKRSLRNLEQRMVLEMSRRSLLDLQSPWAAFSSRQTSEWIRQQTFSRSTARCPSSPSTPRTLSSRTADCSKLSNPPMADSSIMSPSLKTSRDFSSSVLTGLSKVVFMKFLWVALNSGCGLGARRWQMLLGPTASGQNSPSPSFTRPSVVISTCEGDSPPKCVSVCSQQYSRCSATSAKTCWMTLSGRVMATFSRSSREPCLKYSVTMETAPSGQLQAVECRAANRRSSASRACHNISHSLMAWRHSLELRGSSLTQTSRRVGTWSIFLTVPVWCPRLRSSRVMQSGMRSPWGCLVERALYLLMERSRSWSCSLNLVLILRYFWQVARGLGEWRKGRSGGRSRGRSAGWMGSRYF